MVQFIAEWVNHNMRTRGRTNLYETNIIWNNFYDEILSNSTEYEDLSFEKDLLFRVHTGGTKKPIFEDYEDYGGQSQEFYKNTLANWKSDNDINAINFDNSWVSFTEDPEVITSHYFGSKNLRGFVRIREVTSK